MKEQIKKGLHVTGLLPMVQAFYFNLKTSSPSVLRREIAYRRHGAPDGLPLPPPKLIYEVIACRWAAVFLDSGKIVADDMVRILEKNSLSLDAFGRLLDFGCGCGRILRHFAPLSPGVHLYGSDYNPRLIAWDPNHLDFADFSTNQLSPPLPYDSGHFDFVYARSVFTHLPEDLQQAWIQELHRILAPGGVLYFTTHGRPLTLHLPEALTTAFDADDLVVLREKLAGDNRCTTFQSFGYTKNTLLTDFDLLDFVEGRDTDHLRQDVYLVRKKSL